MAARQRVLETADRILGGEIGRSIRSWRAEGKSYDDIAVALRDHGVSVTGETVRSYVLAVLTGDEQ